MNRYLRHAGDLTRTRGPMFLTLSKKSRKTNRTKTKRLRAGLKAKNANRRARLKDGR